MTPNFTLSSQVLRQTYIANINIKQWIFFKLSQCMNTHADLELQLDVFHLIFDKCYQSEEVILYECFYYQSETMNILIVTVLIKAIFSIFTSTL